MNAYTATGLAEGFIDGTPDQQLEAWQYLENTGLAYELQGSFGRQCQALIADGLITARQAQPEMRAFLVTFTWTTPSGTGSSSINVAALDAAKARRAVKRVFADRYAGYTFGEFTTVTRIA